MIKPIISDAVRNLVEGKLSCHGTFESIIYHDGQTPPTKKQAEDKLVELQAEYDALEYARNRQPLYPEIGDQLDDLYHKGAFSDEMTATLKKVKDDNPK